jgi:signal transduction histidine kinase/DNA-binding NarL/FixJ family response regulator
MLQHWKLLIVDDCAADRTVYRRFLAKDPQQTYEFLEADSAADGLLICQQERSHVILLDYCLPDMSGLEFLELLSEQSTYQAHLPTPVIMLTGNGDEAIAVQAIKRGAQDYLVKQSIRADVLQLAVRNVLRRSDLQNRLTRTQGRQQLIATTALRIRQSLNLSEILETTVAEVRRLLECDRVIVYQFNQPSMTALHGSETSLTQQSGKVVSESVAEGWSKLLGLVVDESTGFYNSPEQLDQIIDQYEVRTKLAVPIYLVHTEEGIQKFWGMVIAHQCSSSREWQADEVGILEELSVQLAIAIQQSELLSQTQTALNQEKELNTLKSQIITTVSHEYRTPLTSILAAASTLKHHSGHLDQERQQRMLEIIEQKSRQMAKLIDDMLTVSQLEMKRKQLTLHPFDLAIFLNELLQEQQAHTTGQQIDCQIEGDLEGFWGDHTILRQIFLNLLSNAIKYSPPSGKIQIQLTGSKTDVTFVVRDQGIGISGDDQARLFQLFSRGSNVGTIPGTGLGLAIAKACAELHGGTISYHSEIGQGATFSVRLPKNH